MTTNLQRIAFTSQNRYERVVSRASQTFSMVSFGSATVTFTHSLGYVPYVEAWYSYSSGKKFTLTTGPGTYDIDGNGGQVRDAQLSSTTFSVTFDNFGGSTINGTVYVRIYAEPQ